MSWKTVPLIPSPPPKTNVLREHALNNPYIGPSQGGDHFYGWPVTELMKSVMKNSNLTMADLVDELQEIHAMTRYGQLPISINPAAGQQQRARPYTYEERLAMRMGWGRPEESKWASGFEHVAIHKAAGSDKVHVWVITKDAQSVVLEDEAPLFPTDVLVAKLNMMKQE